MNHPFVAERAVRLSRSTNRIPDLYQFLYQRDPTEEELQMALEFLRSDTIRELGNPNVRNWTYGYGEIDVSTKRVSLFKPLPHFNGTEYQGGEDYPDPKLGWLKLTSKGGHPGNDLKHAIVRRWTAIEDGVYSVSSRVSHEPEVGDGIHAFICHNERGVLKSATVHHSTEQLDVTSIPIWKGDTIDFIVDIRAGLNSDQFLWSATVSKDGDNRIWDTEKDFTPPIGPHLTPSQQLVQVLMLANEFMFVD